MFQAKRAFGGKGFIGNISESKQRQARRAARGLHIEPLESRLLFSTFTVTSLADNGGTGELRWAVQQANAAGGTNTIDFQSGLTGTITLISGQIAFGAGNITIDGPGAGSLTVSGGGVTRVFQIESGATATLSGLNITDGYVKNANGGGIENAGNLTVTTCTFSGDSANVGGGGAIWNSNVLTVTNSTLDGNLSYDGGGGIGNAGTLSVSNCTLSGNLTYGSGGGIWNSGTLAVTNSTFYTNSANSYGGGIYTSGKLTVTNSILDGNSALGESSLGGGGIAAVGPATTDATLYNTIVANNFLDINNSSTPNDIYGNLDAHLAAGQTASSNNLIGYANTAGGLVGGVRGNIVGVASAKLGPLQNNGGPTETMALLGGSPAINAGSNALALDANGKPLTTDQRGTGFARIGNGIVDIGAYEVQAAPHLVFHTKPTSGTAGTAIASIVVYIENSANSVVTTDNSTITMSVNTGPGTLTVKVAAKDGIATFSNNLILDVSGTYTLSASDGADTGAASNSFVIGTAAAAKLVFAAAPTNSIAGNYYSPPVVAYVEDAFSNIVRNVTTAVTLSVASGPGKVFGVTTINLSNGAAIFSDVWFQTAGVYKLTAKDGTLTPIISPTFTIAPAAPAKLVFTTLPTTAKHGVAFTVKVSVEDGFGNIVTAQTGGTISLTLATHPASSVLGGTLTANIVAGVATFSNLTVSLAGTYSLLANNSFGLPTTTSNSFVAS